jgi:hypothetical protein
MSLSTFFNDPDNFVTREKIFLNRLCFDLKLAAAHRHMPIQIFTPEHRVSAPFLAKVR